MAEIGQHPGTEIEIDLPRINSWQKQKKQERIFSHQHSSIFQESIIDWEKKKTEEEFFLANAKNTQGAHSPSLVIFLWKSQVQTLRFLRNFLAASTKKQVTYNSYNNYFSTTSCNADAQAILFKHPVMEVLTRQGRLRVWTGQLVEIVRRTSVITLSFCSFIYTHYLIDPRGSEKIKINSEMA
jgi:hypothetical protein